MGWIADHRNPRSLAARLRRRRFRAFVALLEGCESDVRILDAGGTARFWERHADLLPASVTDITVVNLHPAAAEGAHDVTCIMADVRDLGRFGDDEFDVCFSNSVIEHVGGPADQAAMADEIRRVARGHFVQTPNRYFPIEPHFLFPGWQFLPVGLRVALNRRVRLGWMAAQPDPDRCRARVLGIRLLGRREFAGMFPDSEIRRERFGPLTKSWIAVLPPAANRPADGG